jgi:hypothetical protein
MTDRFRTLKRTIVLLALASFAIAAIAWGAVALVTTVTPVISLTTGALILGCGVTYGLIHRSSAAHDRSIRDTYPSFGPALARRRAEAQTPA